MWRSQLSRRQLMHNSFPQRFSKLRKIAALNALHAAPTSTLISSRTSAQILPCIPFIFPTLVSSLPGEADP